MRSRGSSQSERLQRETEHFLNDSRKQIWLLDLPEAEARRNIRKFLERLPQFNDPEKQAVYAEPAKA